MDRQPAPVAGPPGAREPFLRVERVTKRFGGVHALRGVDLTIQEPGTVHGLIGENGSGKSTLLGILSGQLTPDSGAVLLDGSAVTLSPPIRALGHGIGMVSQEIAYAADLSVAENVLMGRRLPRSALGIDWRAGRRVAASILARLGVDLDVDLLMRDLRPDQRQMVEIARALSMHTRILILDEPTSSLDKHEADALFAVMRALKSEGVTVVFVSHRLDELFALSDRITVLRDGRTVAEGPLDAFTPESVIEAMVGPHREPSAGPGRRPVTVGGPPALVVEDVRSLRAVDTVSLTVERGEIVGLAGQLGSGRSELLECIFGSRSMASGRVVVGGRAYDPSSPRAAIRAGIAFVPPDRKRQGLVLSGTIRSNLMAAAMSDRRRLGLPSKKSEDEVIDELVRRMRVRMHDTEDPVSTLSGGNQQKVAIGKWLARGPDVMLLDEPTRGVDVAAKADVHGLLRDIAADGAALLVSSSELSELLGLCHRVLVMAQGRVVGETDTADADEETLLRYITLAPRESA